MLALSRGYHPEAVEGWKAVLHVVVTGGEDWTVKLWDSELAVSKGKVGTPTCVVTTDLDTFAGICSGELPLGRALEESKVVATNPKDATKLGLAFDMKKVARVASIVAASRALLVVEGVGAREIERARNIGCFFVIAVLVGTYFSGTYLFPSFAARSSFFEWRIAIVLGMCGAYVAERFVRPRAGRVEFYDRGIVFVKQRSRVSFLRVFLTGSEPKLIEDAISLEWSELQGFRDDSSEHVALVKKDGESSLLTVPTLNEKDRVAVLKLLDERGVPRVE